jgi:hypothetical protein
VASDFGCPLLQKCNFLKCKSGLVAEDGGVVSCEGPTFRGCETVAVAARYGEMTLKDGKCDAPSSAHVTAERDETAKIAVEMQWEWTEPKAEPQGSVAFSIEPEALSKSQEAGAVAGHRPGPSSEPTLHSRP